MNISNWDARRIAFWLGVVAYISSFFLLAVGDFRGYGCAFWSLAAPLLVIREKVAGKQATSNALQICIFAFASGLTNPSFAFFAVTSRLGSPRSTVRLFQILAVVFILFAIMTLQLFRFPARAGFYVWLVGMFLALVSYRPR